MERRKWFKPLEAVIVVITIVFCSIVIIRFINRKQGDMAFIHYDGELLMKIDLQAAKDETFTLETNPNVHFKVQDNKICFIDVNCPDKLCENVGYISLTGEIAVCMPNKTTLKVVSSGDMDAIVK